MGERTKLLGLLSFWIVLQACSGGSACGGCVEPIPGGFPLEQRTANAAQARLTPNAITFLESNYAALIETLLPDGLTFPIDESTTTIPVIGDATICPGGGCSATINITGVDIQLTPPSSIVVVALLEVTTTNIRIDIHSNAMCLFLSSPRCDVDLDSRRTAPPNNTIRLVMTFTIDTRTGYTSLNISDAGLADDIQNGDIRIRGANTCGDIW